MRHHNQRYAFVVSTPLDVRKGYGTAAAVLGLMEALHRKGKRVGLVEPSPVGLSDPIRSWWFNLHLPSELSRLDVDCVVGIDFNGYRYARRRQRRAFISLLHGVKADELPWEQGPARRRLQWAVRWERRAAQHADLVLAPSAYACRRASEEYGVPAERTRVVPNGIDLNAWPLLAPADGPPRVVAGAQLIKRKGLDHLILAWPRVREQVPDALLDIAGDGPEKARLAQLASESGVGHAIRFHGARGQSEFKELLRSAHVCCLPSRQEAFGLVLLEAMASGRPVVAARAGAIPEVVGEAGLLVEPGSAEALAHAIVRALSDSSIRAALVTAGRERAQGFAWDRAAAMFGTAAAQA